MGRDSGIQRGDHNTMVDIEALKSKYLNLVFDRRDFTVQAENSATVARISGETRPEYIDPAHAAFEVFPAYIASLSSGRHLPIDFPALGGLPVDGGKAVTSLQPVPAGVPLNGRTHLHDIYDKSGRSGRMVFLISRMEIYDAAEKLLALADSRMVIRERSES
ncbi:MAG: MaoC family dehydratase [Gammaproteobacteria bacterium]|nr:MaoC family dehydratase [Gammaproteobacteria bacterium]